MTNKIDNYYKRHDPTKEYEEILFRDGYGAQAADHNDLQGLFKDRFSAFGSALFKDGDIITDAQISVDTKSGEVKAQAGSIYLDGYIRTVPQATFSIPVRGSIAVGVHLVKKVITEKEDPTLYNPAVGTGTHGQPGSWRLQVKATWGFDGDGVEGDFYPVHIVDDGIVRSKEAPPNLGSFYQGIARYDRASTGGGTYICNGLNVRVAEISKDHQIFTVTEGRAHVHGYGVEIPTSRRLSYDPKPDLRFIDTEIHTADGSTRQRINVAHAPIHNITSLRATVRKTVSIVHGAYTGVHDPLPDTGVVKIVECKQGETTYVVDTDYKKTGDSVDWSPTGNEPAPGSTYECTYDYIATVEAKDKDFDGFYVEGAVASSSIILSYNQSVPRLDKLCLTQEGTFQWIKGIAAERNPQPPAIPDGMLAIATIYQNWREFESLVVKNDGVKVVPFDIIESHQNQLDYLYREVARQRLEAEISTKEAGTRVGIFVDPLIDDSCRDQGIKQTASVIDGKLTLSIKPKVHALASMLAPATPSYTPSPILSQLLRTGSMKVNPYAAFDPLPARVTLNPSVDQWTEVKSTWTSPLTQVFGRGNRSVTTNTTQVLSSTTTDLEFLRQIPVEFTIEGFAPKEKLRKISFDGVEVTSNPAEIVANDLGVARGSFTIPANITSGAKTVTFSGNPDGGSRGSAVFVGQSKLTVQTVRQVSTTQFYRVDPLAQTFTLDSNAQVCGVDLWFTEKSGDVRVQIREVQNGIPTATIIAEAHVLKDSIIVTGGGHTRVNFPVLCNLLSSTEYAIVVMCDDPITSLAIAEMGKFDATAQKWVAAQPYTVGVLLSSSNASTWTAHQTKDMTFRLLGASFASGLHQVDMGSAEVKKTTDLMVLALDETPTALTRVEYEVGLPDGTSLFLAQGQPIRLPTPISGEVTVKAKLSGTKHSGPLLWPGAQLLTGEVSQKDDYYSRSIPAVGAKRVVLIYDAFIPSGATIKPELQVDSGEWVSMDSKGTINQGEGVMEYTFATSLEKAELVKCRFTLTGTSSARPAISNIRFMAIE